MRGMDGEPQQPTARSDRFLAHRGLIGLCCGTAMAEAFLLIVLAPAARALAPQVSALPPLAIFHDLRWLYSAQRSWLSFARMALPPPDAVPIAGLAGLVNARAWYGLTAAIARSAGQAHAELAETGLAGTALAGTALAG